MQWLVERYEYNGDSLGSVPHQLKDNGDKYEVKKTIMHMIATGCRQDAADESEEVPTPLDTKKSGLGTSLPPFVTILMAVLLLIPLGRFAHNPRWGPWSGILGCTTEPSSAVSYW